MKLYSNEIVFRGHPDKVCDQISNAILDKCLQQDKNSRCGIEVVGGKGKIFITGEVTTNADIVVELITKRVLEDIGCNTNYEIINNLGKQSPDIAQGVDIGGAGDNGCIAKGELVTTKTGYKKIEDVVIGDYVLTRSGFKRVVNSQKTGTKETITITTNLGRNIKLTPEHKIWCKTGWVNAVDALNNEVFLHSDCEFNKDIEYSSFMETPSDFRGGRLNGRDTHLILNNELAYILGLLIGDGSICNKKYMCFCFKNKDKIDDTISIIKNAFKDATIKINKNGLIVNGILYRKALEDMGLGYWSSKEKQIPNSILNNNLEIQKNFIRGLFDTDGSVYTYKNKGRNKTSCKLTVSSISKELLNQVQLILKNLNIDCFLGSNGIGVSEKVVGKSECFVLNIRGGESLLLYNSLIGFNVRYKKDILKQFCESYVCNKKINSTEFIKSINTSEICDVYDLEVEDAHEFFVNGILVHNSMFGYACNDNDKMLPTAMVILQEFAEEYDILFQTQTIKRFLPDGKAQITGIYDDEFKLVNIKNFTICYQNTELEREYTDKILIDIANKICDKYGVSVENYLINPTGKFLIGGFDGDSGLTGRKIVVDAYQGFANVGGGCVDYDTEFLSLDGWKKIGEYVDGDKVAQWTDGELEFVTPIDYIKTKAENMYRIKTSQNIDMILSENHNVLYRTSKKNWNKKKLKDILYELDTKTHGSRIEIPLWFNNNFTYSNGIDLTDEEIKLQVAFCADGSILDKSRNRGRIRIKKDYKIKRIIDLLNSIGIDYRISDDKEYKIFWFTPPILNKCLLECFKNCNRKQAEVIANEVVLWDGNRKNIFRTTIKKDADFIQLIFSSVFNTSTSITLDDRVEGLQYNNDKEYIRKSICYCVYIKKNKYSSCFRTKNKYSSNLSIVPFYPKDNLMYCFNVPSHNLILRNNNNIYITGNCFNGKDPSKVDMSGAYKARQIACNILKKHNLKWCEVQLSYSIGIVEPMAIYITSDIGEIEADYSLYIECQPNNIIKDLRLKEICYEEKAKFGHFR